MIEHVRDAARHWIWRCHIDLSAPNRDIVEFLARWWRRYDAAVFHRPQYVPDVDGLPTGYIWPPAIDPLAPKNMALSAEDAAYIVDQFGIDVDRPLLTQVSRFDPWKDPLGVIDAYRLVREERPDVQLALVGSMAHDDPEGWDFYNQTIAHAAGDPDIYILSNLNNVGSVEVNAFQVSSAAVIQKSIREGFGLTVSEALWKGRPIVAGRVGGIVTQIEEGRDRLARRLAGGVRRRVRCDLARSGGGPTDGARRQGGRPDALPDAAAPPRLAGAVQPAARKRHRRREARDDRVGGVAGKRPGTGEARAADAEGGRGGSRAKRRTWSGCGRTAARAARRVP